MSDPHEQPEPDRQPERPPGPPAEPGRAPDTADPAAGVPVTGPAPAPDPLSEAVGGTGDDGAPAAAAAEPEEDRRLSPKTMVTASLNQLRSFIIPIAVALFAGQFNPWVLGGSGIALVGILISGVYTYKTFRYRVGAERLEIRSGLIARSRRTIPLERIRGVDITSTLLHRVFGLAVVKIEAAAGGSGAEEGKLDAVTRAEAERLRTELLHRRALLTGAPEPDAAAVQVDSQDPQTEEGGHEQHAPGAAAPADVVYFQMPTRWYFYAVLSLGYLLTPFAALAALFGFASQVFGGDTLSDYLADGAIAAVDAARDGLLVLVLLAVGLVLFLAVAMPLFAVITYAVNHWNFTLRRSGESLVTERGLFTRRSVTLEHRRIRGHELADTPLERTRSLVKLSAIVTGLADSSTRATLLPIGKRVTVDAVVARALAPFTASLIAHPPAARTRRLVRAIVPFALLAAGAGALGWYWVAGGLAVLALLGVPLGLDRYRSLGHGYDGGRVSVRSGSLQRGQAVVEQGAIIGWSWSQTLFQRRSGLATMEVAVGAGSGSYDAVDADFHESVAFAADVTPAMIGPFLVAEPEPDQGRP
ncbi:PH domain-containing protein [Nocardiopsis ansamitocini]|uniref:YdbS-like PH domain-containing protein n=1 Tax=Nocardiopsis ansamitocini TaxID=1670832 RepID=A0A9W6P8E1_9ACTN|nr:PH domain-containing protein [Nocardiopsis ansamitocini]GLU49050.1 hypothetical protein Nans01_34010 [Nocardiopsis ansamitocini]